MKRIKRFLGVFIALFILFPVLTNAATELSASTQSPVVGNYVYIQLEANYGTELKIRDFHVYIDYDTSFFSLEETFWLKSYRDEGTTRNENGRLYVDKVDGNWSSGAVLQMKFRVLKAGFTEIKIGRNGESYYTNGDYIAQTTANISINATEPSTDTIIGSIQVEGYSLEPVFSRTTYNYNLTVPSNVSSVKINATKGESHQTITGTGTIDLDYGYNRVRIIVTAQNNSSRTYEIIINREDDRSGDTTLKNLSVSNTNIKYIENETVYNAIVSKSVNSVFITGRTNDVNATLTGTGKMNLNMGLNTFNLTVSTSGGKKQIYTINITRSNEELENVVVSSKLKSLKINGLTLDLSNNKNKFYYSINNNITEVPIEAITESSTATIEITGNEKLKNGLNNIIITVTETNEEKSIYNLIVYKNPKDAIHINNLNNINGKSNYIYTTTANNNYLLSKEKAIVLKNNNKKLYYNVVNIYNGLLYQAILSKTIPDNDINFAFNKIESNYLTYQTELPKNVEMLLNLEEQYVDNTNVKIYSYDEIGKYTLITAGVKVNNGYITFTTNGQKYYVITTIDLIKEENIISKFFNKNKFIILGIITCLIIIMFLFNTINKKKQEKEKNEPLY